MALWPVTTSPAAARAVANRGLASRMCAPRGPQDEWQGSPPSAHGLPTTAWTQAPPLAGARLRPVLLPQNPRGLVQLSRAGQPPDVAEGGQCPDRQDKGHLQPTIYSERW